MAGVNKVILIGNLGKDPEVRTLDNGTAVCNFPVATSESYKDRDGNKVDKTEWHNIVIWRKLAEVAGTYLKKGSKVYLEGKLQTRSWDDEQGNKRYTTEVVANQMVMLDSKGEGQSQNHQPQSEMPTAHDQAGPAAGVTTGADVVGGDDDLPF